MQVVYKKTGDVVDIPNQLYNTNDYAPVQGNQSSATSSSQAAPQPTSQPQSPNLTSSIGNGVLGLLGNILSPLIKGGQTIGEGVNEAAQTGQYLLGNKQAFQNNVLPDFLRLNNQQVNQIRQNPVGEAVKQTAGVGSFLIPFGKGANILSKVLAPGAAVGALQGLSQDNATPASVAGNAVVGLGGAGLLHAALGLPAAVGKLGDASQNIGNSLRQDVSKIQLEPGIYSASREKAIQSTLDKLGINGNAAQKYEKLLPAYQKLGDKIQTELSNNPKTVPIDQVINDLTTNLNANKTLDLSGSKAKDAVNTFIKSVYPTGDSEVIPKNIGTDQLFSLKQQINQGYSTIANKLRNGQPLSDTEKVIATARKTLDDIIANEHPQVKALTTQQSHLYDAAQSLASSRNDPHLIKALGIEIPTGGLKDLAGRAAQNVGKLTTNSYKNPLDNPLVNQILSQGSGRFPLSAVNNGGNQVNSQNTNNNNKLNNNDQGNNVNGQVDHTSMIPDQNGNSNSQYPITPQMVSLAYQIYPSKVADRLKSAYDAQFLAVGGNRPLSPTQQVNKANADDGLRALNAIQGKLQSDPGVLLKKILPGPVAGDYKAAETTMLNNLIYLKTGKQASDQERKSYQQLLPQPGDSSSTIQYKLGVFKDFFNQLANKQVGVGGDITTGQ